MVKAIAALQTRVELRGELTAGVEGSTPLLGVWGQHPRNLDGFVRGFPKGLRYKFKVSNPILWSKVHGSYPEEPGLDPPNGLGIGSI